MVKAIYQIENIVNHKKYIGQTIHPERRWKEHCQHAKYHNDDYPIHLAINKYGKENFIFTILEWTEQFDQREKELIIEYNTLVPNGYNIATGGNSCVLIGEDHPRNTISNNTVANIIFDLQNNFLLTDREIAKKYNTTDKIVADINHGYSHRIEEIKYPIRNRKGSQKLSDNIVAQIKQDLKFTQLSYTEIAKKYSTTKTNIAQINHGRSWKRPNEIYPIREGGASIKYEN